MSKNVDPYEHYREDLDGKVVSGKEAGGDYKFQFDRPKNRHGDIHITRLSTDEKFKATIALTIECNVKMSLDDLPDDLKIEFSDLKEKTEYKAFIDSLKTY